jgi:CYTH domain-containing protein
MTDSSNHEILSLLKEIRDNQAKQLELQSEAVNMQREQFRMFTEQYEKTSKLTGRAEDVQEKARLLMDKAGKVFAVIIPLLIIAIGYFTWLMFR